MMLTVLDLAREDTRLSNKSRNELSGPCPDQACRCQTNGFSVKYDGIKWGFMCRGCYDATEYLSEKDRKRGWGDVIDYLRHYRKMSYQQARALLAGQEIPDTPYCHAGKEDYTSPHWQARTTQAMKDYEQALWNDEGLSALLYVRGRGLIDRTIRNARMGFSLQHGIPRLLIPSFNDGRYVAIYRRDIRSDCSKGDRWKDAPGSSKNELYLADCLISRRPTVMVESAIDALSLVQECGDLCNIVATGGTSGARTPQSLARLALMPDVLVAFDADQDGDEAAVWWIDHLPTARRLRPFLHDINDMLIDGWDIKAWVQDALVSPPAGEPEPIEQQEELDSCADCKTVFTAADRDFFYSDQGTCYCTTCRSPETGERYAPAMTQEQFMAAVRQAVTTTWPGWQDATIAINPPGYTLADRCRDLQAERKGQKERGEPAGQEDYWTMTRRNLARQGYYEQYARDNDPARRLEPAEPTYPAPFPRRELVNGRSVVVGMWGTHGEKLPL